MVMNALTRWHELPQQAIFQRGVFFLKQSKRSRSTLWKNCCTEMEGDSGWPSVTHPSPWAGWCCGKQPAWAAVCFCVLPHCPNEGFIAGKITLWILKSGILYSSWAEIKNVQIKALLIGKCWCFGFQTKSECFKLTQFLPEKKFPLWFSQYRLPGNAAMHIFGFTSINLWFGQRRSSWSNFPLQSAMTFSDRWIWTSERKEKMTWCQCKRIKTLPWPELPSSIDYSWVLPRTCAAK